MNYTLFIWTILLSLNLPVFGQTSSKITTNFYDPVLVDTNSTVMIPTVYEAGIFTSNKLALYGNYYSNIIFYNFKTDTYKRLFEKDTYIIGFKSRSHNFFQPTIDKQNITSNAIFYQIKNVDYNLSKKIDDKDPTILYISDIKGNNLKRITSENENIISFDIFEKQNFALIKMQRDLNNDKNFDADDSDFYFIKLDLTSFALGNKIELK
jgi:hypothetical protein